MFEDKDIKNENIWYPFYNTEWVEVEQKKIINEKYIYVMWNLIQIQNF